MFKPHYYLDLAMPPAAQCFIGAINGEPVCHLAVTPFFHVGYYRATRLVVMPEWQGAGVGTKFLEWVCRYHKEGNGHLNIKLPTLFHTSHPQLIGYLKNSPNWALTSQQLFGGLKSASRKSINNAMKKSAGKFGGKKESASAKPGFGGHFRAVQGFKYIG